MATSQTTTNSAVVSVDPAPVQVLSTASSGATSVLEEASAATASQPLTPTPTSGASAAASNIVLPSVHADIGSDHETRGSYRWLLKNAFLKTGKDITITQMTEIRFRKICPRPVLQQKAKRLFWSMVDQGWIGDSRFVVIRSSVGKDKYEVLSGAHRLWCLKHFDELLKENENEIKSDPKKLENIKAIQDKIAWGFPCSIVSGTLDEHGLVTKSSVDLTWVDLRTIAFGGNMSNDTESGNVIADSQAQKLVQLFDLLATDDKIGKMKRDDQWKTLCAYNPSYNQNVKTDTFNYSMILASLSVFISPSGCGYMWLSEHVKSCTSTKQQCGVTPVKIRYNKTLSKTVLENKHAPHFINDYLSTLCPVDGGTDGDGGAVASPFSKEKFGVLTTLMAGLLSQVDALCAAVSKDSFLEPSEEDYAALFRAAVSSLIKEVSCLKPNQLKLITDTKQYGELTKARLTAAGAPEYWTEAAADGDCVCIVVPPAVGAKSLSSPENANSSPNSAPAAAATSSQKKRHSGESSGGDEDHDDDEDPQGRNSDKASSSKKKRTSGGSSPSSTAPTSTAVALPRGLVRNVDFTPQLVESLRRELKFDMVFELLDDARRELAHVQVTDIIASTHDVSQRVIMDLASSTDLISPEALVTVLSADTITTFNTTATLRVLFEPKAVLSFGQPSASADLSAPAPSTAAISFVRNSDTAAMGQPNRSTICAVTMLTEQNKKDLGVPFAELLPSPAIVQHLVPSRNTVTGRVVLLVNTLHSAVLLYGLAARMAQQRFRVYVLCAAPGVTKSNLINQYCRFVAAFAPAAVRNALLADKSAWGGAKMMALPKKEFGDFC